MTPLQTLKTASYLFGIVFIVIGLLGFISNPLVGPAGYFLTNNAHNLVHIMSGIIFLAIAAGAEEKLPLTFKVFGFAYLLVAVLGFFTSQPVYLFGMMLINTADNWLHLFLSLIILALGYSYSPASKRFITR